MKKTILVFATISTLVACSKKDDLIQQKSDNNLYTNTAKKSTGIFNENNLSLKTTGTVLPKAMPDGNLTKILGTWDVANITRFSFKDGVFEPEQSEIIIGAFGDYFKFDSANQLYTKVHTYAPRDLNTYQFSYNLNHIFIKDEDGNILDFTITSLTTTQLNFETKRIYDPTHPDSYEKIGVKLTR